MATRTRTRTRTQRLANGTTVTRLAPAEPLEWEIQAEAVRRLRQLPGYGDAAARGVQFTLAGDFNAARRSPREAVKAKATGIAAGEPDLRIYGAGGRLLLIEMKGPKTPVRPDQRKRHALLEQLGFTVHIVRGMTIEQGAADVVAIVLGWLAANDDRAPAAAAEAA